VISYEGRETNQRLIYIKKNKRHVDMGSNPKESSVRGRKPKGRYPFPLISKGRDRNIDEEYKHECYLD
jgi:hypothetical protein